MCYVKCITASYPIYGKQSNFLFDLIHYNVGGIVLESISWTK